MYYNKSKESLIIRDMNWIAKSIMSDRREDSKNENIKCYIYPGKTTVDETINTITDKFNVNTGNVVITGNSNTGNIINTTPNKPESN
ncbi:TPA: hypothetical protein DIC40_04415 [Patescibacteria group bacterium]|nr:hypothetical protein [Candidatus Gracilibacteria bacterium]